MVRKSLSTRYLLLEVSLFSLIILYSRTSYVTGQPVLTTGLAANCGDDITLTCSQPGFDITAGRLWKKGSVTISETGKDSSGTDRYSEKSTSNDFSLVISNAILADVDYYTCEYEFVPSNAEPLSFECQPTEWNVDVTRSNQEKLNIYIKNIYPSSVNIAVACALQGKSPTTIKGTSGTPTPNGDHFDIKWMSDDTISAGTYDCSITVNTTTSNEIIKTGLIFSDPTSVDDNADAVIGLAISLTVSCLVNVFSLVCCIKDKCKRCCKCEGTITEEGKSGKGSPKSSKMSEKQDGNTEQPTNDQQPHTSRKVNVSQTVSEKKPASPKSSKMSEKQDGNTEQPTNDQQPHTSRKVNVSQTVSEKKPRSAKSSNISGKQERNTHQLTEGQPEHTSGEKNVLQTLSENNLGETSKENVSTKQSTENQQEQVSDNNTDQKAFSETKNGSAESNKISEKQEGNTQKLTEGPQERTSEKENDPQTLSENELGSAKNMTTSKIKVSTKQSTENQHEQVSENATDQKAFAETKNGSAKSRKLSKIQERKTQQPTEDQEEQTSGKVNAPSAVSFGKENEIGT